MNPEITFRGNVVKSPSKAFLSGARNQNDSMNSQSSFFIVIYKNLSRLSAFSWEQTDKGFGSLTSVAFSC